MARFRDFSAFLSALLLVLGASHTAAQDRSNQVQIQSQILEAQRDALKDLPVFRLGFWGGSVFLSPDVEASTTLGTADQASADGTQGGLALDGQLSLPLFDRRVLSLILGARVGSMVGNAWSAALDLDPFINGRDTDISGELRKFGGLYVGVDRAFWIDPKGRVLKLGVLAGGGFMEYEIDGTTLFGSGVPLSFSDDETLGYFFAEAVVSYLLTCGTQISLNFGIQQTENFSFDVPAQFGDARFDIDNDLDLTISGRFSIPIGTRYASDRRLKRDIRHLATRPDGLRLYAFRYLWDETIYVGVMAQDLLASETWRGAVSTMANGYYAVDYRQLGLRMMTLKSWPAGTL